MKVEAYGKTDPGRVRKNNEDNLLVDLETGLFIVADGMGGHNAGEIASKMAVDVVRDSFKRFIVAGGSPKIIGKVNPQFSERTNQLASCVRLSNQFIFESARAKPQHQGMGTTIDCFYVLKNKVSISHIGDSRIYMVRDGKLKQVTADHSLVADQVRQGILKQDEAEKSHLKNILTRALGVDENVEVDMTEVEGQDKDLFIACTDGLNKMVSDAEIMKTVLEMKTPKMITEHLIDLANAAGGVDNVTVVCVQLHK